jgi:hypothetical protein
LNKVKILSWSTLSSKDFWILLPFGLFISNLLVIDYINHFLIFLSGLFLLRNSIGSLVGFNQLIILCFSILYYQFSETSSNENGYIVIFRYCFFPVFFYILGNYLSFKYSTIENKITIVNFFIILFTTIPFFSNLISIVSNGIGQQRDLEIFTFGSEKILVVGTIMASFFSINIALLPFFIIFPKDKFEKKMTIFFQILYLIGLLVVFNVSSRTGIIISIISVLPLLIIFPIKSLVKFKTFFFTFLLIFFLNVSGPSNFIFSSNLYLRFTEESSALEIFDSRGLIWQEAIESINLYGSSILVNNDLITSNYAHNLWLDVALSSGLVPAFLLIIVSLSSLVSLFKFIRFTTYTQFYRLFICSIFIAFYAVFFVEPIMQGLFKFFCFFMFMFGFIQLPRQFKRS